MQPMGNRLPTGPGSRGGTYHLPGKRAEYDRAWRAAHPEYRERERLRRHRARMVARGLTDNAADIVVAPSFPRPLPSPNAGIPCRCGSCNCTNTILVVRCDMCMRGLHEEPAGPTLQAT